MNESIGWHTDDELVFVRGLGLRACAGHEMSREQLLRNYLSAMSQRTDWRGIDPNRVAAAAREALDFERFASTRIG